MQLQAQLHGAAKRMKYQCVVISPRVQDVVEECLKVTETGVPLNATMAPQPIHDNRLAV